MTLVRFKGQNHPQQVLVHGAKAHVDERATPPEYFAELDRRFRFTELVVMLLPANRTEQGWWQRQVEPYRDRDRGLRVEFLPGRLRFLSPGARRVGANERPPFGSCLLIWEPIRPLSSPSRKPAVAPESTR